MVKCAKDFVRYHVWGNSSVVTACEKKLANQGRWGPFKKLHVISALKKASVVKA